MGMTMSQKILAAHAGLEEVKAGQLIEADLDLVLGNDITSPVAINEMKKMDRKTVFDKDKIALVMDHFIPNKDIKSAENCKCCREFACHHEMWATWELSMPFFLKRDWWWPETRSLARIPTHVHTEPWERFPQARGARIWQPAW